MELVPERLRQQIEFVMEIDKLKQIYRQNLIADTSRRENDAEHSWHIALMAVLLREYAEEPVDLEKVIKMLLIHDLVEVYAGDTFCYDEEAVKDKDAREKEAAQRLYSLLPADQEAELRGLWHEFEERKRRKLVLPRAWIGSTFLLNYLNRGGTWKMHLSPATRFAGVWPRWRDLPGAGRVC